MTSLKSLYLMTNVISDVFALGGLTSLETLILSSNRISEFSLSELKSLKTLDLKNNRLTSVTVIGSLSNIEKLYLDHNRILDFTPLKGNSYVEITATDNSVQFTGVN